jgi:hypothetical protein
MGQNKSKKKKPKAAVTPSTERQPVAGAKPQHRKRPVPGARVEPEKEACVVFGLQLMDHEGPFGWSELTPDDIKTIRDKCRSWETMTVVELLQVASTKPIPAEKFEADAQKRVKEIELDDYDGFWELRLGGKPRIWGVLRQNVFYLVWWDPLHLVCPAHKRHT